MDDISIEAFNKSILSIKTQIEEIDETLAPLRDEDLGIQAVVNRLKAFQEDVQTLKNLVTKSEGIGESLLTELQRLHGL